jgi:hypothetical protein
MIEQALRLDASADPVFARLIDRTRLACYVSPGGGQCDRRFDDFHAVAMGSDSGIAGRIARVSRDTIGFVSRKPTEAIAGHCRSQLEMPEVASDYDACAVTSPSAAEDNGMVRRYTGRWDRDRDRSAPR